MAYIRTFIFLFSCILFSGCVSLHPEYSQRTDVEQFAAKMSREYHFDEAQLLTLFNHVRTNQKIIHAMTKPHEASPWYRYRPIFVTAQKVKEGARFWQQHARTLAYAEKQYGVPPQIIIAILGVETNYGKNQGADNALEALSTLAFSYPPRAHYFQSELTQYLLLTREIQIDPLRVKSSYAGALGQAQFMPSSYRDYAIGYLHAGRGDLFRNTDDAIISVANYFKLHGWEKGGIVAVRAHLRGKGYTSLPPHQKKPIFTLAQLAHYGVYSTQRLPSNLQAFLIKLQDLHANEYWLGFHNFYVIMRYNTSPLYAMAVYQLSQQIKKENQMLSLYKQR
jgi:membrane-bound lytic murein transglycosylase B